MKKYYILSIKHTRKGDQNITWFRPNNCGYTHFLKAAGKYTQYQIDNKDWYYNNGVNLAVPCEVVDALSTPGKSPESSDIVVEIKHLKSLFFEFRAKKTLK